MANLNRLQRYNLVGEYYPTMVEMKDGDYLKFEDVKELLNTTTNTGSAQCDEELCPECNGSDMSNKCTKCGMWF